MSSNVQPDHPAKDPQPPRHKASPGLLLGTRRRLRRWWAENSTFNGVTPLPIPADVRRERLHGRRRATTPDGPSVDERREGRGVI